jgi:hypothetical protein
MFGLSKAKPAAVLEHWYALIPGFNTSTQEFYQAIEAELKAREVPGLQLSRVEFNEGSVLSDKREYLRLTRERLVFDVCAAPFGTSYFFSCRFAEIPAVIRLWQLLVVLAGSLLIVVFAFKFLGLTLGAIILAAGFVFLIYILRNAVNLDLRDLDAYLLKDPMFGAIYERWFRQETYYRQDTRLMYLDTVNAVVKGQVERVAGTNGVKLLRFNEHSPILAELYPARTVTPDGPKP